MYEFAPVLGSAVDRGIRPVVRFAHVTLGLSPDQVTWAAFWVSAAAAGGFVTGRLVPALVLMAIGQILDALDGGIARQFGLVSEAGHRLDTRLDRAAEIVIFLGCAVGGLVSLRLALLASGAVLLLTTIVDRSKLDSGMNRFALSFGVWGPYPLIFLIIFLCNLAPSLVVRLFIHCR